MKKDSILKHLFNSKVLKNIFIIFILLFIVKLLWFVAEMLWLSPTGKEHNDEVNSKSLYYRVKLTPNEAPPAPIKKQPVKIAKNIKDITLLAIYNSDDTTVITVEYKRKTKVLSTGDVINGFVLEGAGNNFATFSKDNKTYKIVLIKSKNSGLKSSIKTISKVKPQSAKKSTKAEGEITDAGDHRIVDRTLLNHYAKNMDDIYKNIGIKEVKKGGNIQEFAITFIRRGSPFAKLGLRRGDVIKTINGVEINSYNAAFETYKNIQNIQNMTMVIKRGKKEMELEYEVN